MLTNSQTAYPPGLRGNSILSHLAVVALSLYRPPAAAPALADHLPVLKDQQATSCSVSSRQADGPGDRAPPAQRGFNCPFARTGDVCGVLTRRQLVPSRSCGGRQGCLRGDSLPCSGTSRRLRTRPFDDRARGRTGADGPVGHSDPRLLDGDGTPSCGPAVRSTRANRRRLRRDAPLPSVRPPPSRHRAREPGLPRGPRRHPRQPPLRPRARTAYGQIRIETADGCSFPAAPRICALEARRATTSPERPGHDPVPGTGRSASSTVGSSAPTAAVKLVSEAGLTSSARTETTRATSAPSAKAQHRRREQPARPLIAWWWGPTGSTTALLPTRPPPARAPRAAPALVVQHDVPSSSTTTSTSSSTSPSSSTSISTSTSSSTSTSTTTSSSTRRRPPARPPAARAPPARRLDVAQLVQQHEHLHQPPTTEPAQVSTSTVTTSSSSARARQHVVVDQPSRSTSTSSSESSSSSSSSSTSTSGRRARRRRRRPRRRRPHRTTSSSTSTAGPPPRPRLPPPPPRRRAASPARRLLEEPPRSHHQAVWGGLNICGRPIRTWQVGDARRRWSHVRIAARDSRSS